jgi:Glycosyltransferase Family 4
MTSSTNPEPLAILLTNVQLVGRSGTEIVTIELATGLARRGHRVAIFSPRCGPLAEAARRDGLEIIDRLEQLSFIPRMLHGHHHVPTLDALAFFPDLKAIYVCHDRTAWFDLPPIHPRLLRFAAVDANCLERLTVDWAIPERLCTVIPNAVDLARFQPRGPLPARAQRALIFSNYARADTQLLPIQQACADRGLAVDVVGSEAGTATDVPESLLIGYDLVFAKARCALEALSVGCAVIVCDAVGLGRAVTPENLEEMRRWNFGARVLDRPLDPTLIGAEIDLYDPVAAAAVTAIVRQRAGLDVALDRFESLYREALAAEIDPAAWGAQLHTRLQCMTFLEQSHRNRFESPPMPWLREEESRLVEWRVEESTAPTRLACGAPFRLEVRATNRSMLALSSGGSMPIHLSYHWLPQDADPATPLEGVRTPIFPQLGPGETRILPLRGVGPAQPGRYLLRVGLVQETVRWFAIADTDKAHTLEVIVY